MPIALADLATVTAFISAVVGASPEDQSFVIADTTQGKYAPAHITLAAKQADLEICRIIQEVVGQGFRGNYMTVSGELNTGASITPHAGKTGHVEVKYADGTWRPGILIANFEQFNKMKINPDGMYGDGSSLQGRYHITEDDVVDFIGTKLRLRLPNDLTITAALQSPKVYEPAVGRRAVTLLVKDGVDVNLFAVYSQWAIADEQSIRGNAGAIPPLDAFTRAAG